MSETMEATLTFKCVKRVETTEGVEVHFARTQWQIATLTGMSGEDPDYDFRDAHPTEEGAEPFDGDGNMCLTFDWADDPGFEVNGHYLMQDPVALDVPGDE